MCSTWAITVRFVGDKGDVEIDHAVALAVVVGSHTGAGRQLVADAGGCEVGDLAAGVNPRLQHHVLAQRQVAQAQQQARMHQALIGVDRVGLAHIAQVLGSDYPA